MIAINQKWHTAVSGLTVFMTVGALVCSHDTITYIMQRACRFQELFCHRRLLVNLGIQIAIAFESHAACSGHIDNSDVTAESHYKTFYQLVNVRQMDSHNIRHRPRKWLFFEQHTFPWYKLKEFSHSLVTMVTVLMLQKPNISPIALGCKFLPRDSLMIIISTPATQFIHIKEVWWNLINKSSILWDS